MKYSDFSGKHIKTTLHSRSGENISRTGANHFLGFNYAVICLKGAVVYKETLFTKTSCYLIIKRGIKRISLLCLSETSVCGKVGGSWVCIHGAAQAGRSRGEELNKMEKYTNASQHLEYCLVYIQKYIFTNLPFEN